jgi:hypothetical protein
MAISILDNGASIKLTIDTQERYINKSRIVEIAVIKNNFIKIDLQLGALYNIYIPHQDVTSPVSANPAALRDILLGYLASANVGGGSDATAALQNQQITLLSSMKDLLTVMESKVFDEALQLDDSNGRIIYKGFAVIGTKTSEALWAIERIERREFSNNITWANGNKSFLNIWDDREALMYS